MTKIQVVEDTPLNMELLLELIEAQGFEVDGAEDAKLALEKVEKNAYDLIIMDIELPGMNGVEAARIIKKKPEYRTVPIIAQTAYAMKGDKEKFIEAGFDEYVSKLIDVPDFMKLLEKFRK